MVVTPAPQASKYSILIYKVDLSSGRMTCVSTVGTDLRNPAFIRVHPTKNIFWVCTESITSAGEVSLLSSSPDGLNAVSGACF